MDEWIDFLSQYTFINNTQYISFLLPVILCISYVAFAGKKMLLDHDYFRRTRELILGERDRMETELKKLPIFKVYPAYANFILLKIQKEGLTSADVFEACIKKGLMIRDCSSFQCLDGEFVRFCIMMPEDNTRLLDVLKQL